MNASGFAVVLVVGIVMMFVLGMAGPLSLAMMGFGALGLVLSAFTARR